MRGEVGAVVLEATFAGEIAEFGGRDGCGIGLRAKGVGIDGEKALQRIIVVLPGVGLGTADLVAPVFAGGEIPAGAGIEKMLGVALVEARRFEDSLTGNAGVTVVVAQREAKLVGIAESVAKIAGERAIEEIVIGALAVGSEVRASDGIVERTEEAADLRAAAAGGEGAAFAVDASNSGTRVSPRWEKS